MEIIKKCSNYIVIKLNNKNIFMYDIFLLLQSDFSCEY